jgi:hypothetical protein
LGPWLPDCRILPYIHRYAMCSQIGVDTEKKVTG